MAVAMILDTDETSGLPICGASGTQNTAHVIVMQRSNHRKCSRYISSSRCSATISSSTDNVKFCHLCLGLLHWASKCLLLIEATRNLIINQRPIHLPIIPPRSSYRPGNRVSRRIDGATRNTYCSGNRVQRRSAGTHHNSYRFRNRSQNLSGDETPSTWPSVTVTLGATPPAKPASIQPKN